MRLATRQSSVLTPREPRSGGNSLSAIVVCWERARIASNIVPSWSSLRRGSARSGFLPSRISASRHRRWPWGQCGPCTAPHRLSGCLPHGVGLALVPRSGLYIRWENSFPGPVWSYSSTALIADVHHEYYLDRALLLPGSRVYMVTELCCATSVL